METSTTKKKAGRPATNKSTATTTKQQTQEQVVTEVKQVAPTKATQKPKIPKDYCVTCKSGVYGELKYISKRINGMEYIWNEFGDENVFEFEELQSMRNTATRFFQDNWIIIEDSDDYTAQEIYEALNVGQFYKNSLTIDNFDSLFSDSPDKIIQKISNMSSGLKETIAIRAKQLYNSGNIDSIKRIEALEQSLGIELIKKGS